MDIWITILVAFGSALSGVLVGGLSNAILHLWGQVVSGLSASRIVRLELNCNVTFAHYAINRRSSEVNLQEENWLSLRTAVGPLLNQTELTYVDGAFRFVPLAKPMARALLDGSADSSLERNLRLWQMQLIMAGCVLLEMERAGRFRLLWRLIRGRADEAPSIKEIEDRFNPYLAFVLARAAESGEQKA